MIVVACIAPEIDSINEMGSVGSAYRLYICDHRSDENKKQIFITY